MLRIAAFLAVWLISAPALAFLPGQPVGMLNPQALPTTNASAGLPAVDDNLTVNGYPVAGGLCAEWGHQVPCNNHYSITRASSKYVNASDGTYTSIASGVLALGSANGALIEEGRTNLALWGRDLTQSGTWIAVTMTAVKNAVGIDGAANSATTLTSSSAAGTILQSLTASSTAYTYTVFVRGVTVTGAIQVADYPVLTPAFTTLSSSNCFNSAGVGTAPASSQTGFLRCTITATSLNPVIGFKFANSGDSVVVDFNQLEAAAFGTSPILTTTASVPRNADAVLPIGALLALLTTRNVSVAMVAGGASNPATSFPDLLDGDNANNAFSTVLSATTAIADTNGTLLTATFGGGGPTGITKTATGTNSGGTSYVVNNGTLVSNAIQISAVSSPFVGSRSATSRFYDGFIQRATVVGSMLPNAVLKAFTQ